MTRSGTSCTSSRRWFDLQPPSAQSGGGSFPQWKVISCKHHRAVPARQQPLQQDLSLQSLPGKEVMVIQALLPTSGPSSTSTMCGCYTHLAGVRQVRSTQHTMGVIRALSTQTAITQFTEVTEIDL